MHTISCLRHLDERILKEKNWLLCFGAIKTVLTPKIVSSSSIGRMKYTVYLIDLTHTFVTVD